MSTAYRPPARTMTANALGYDCASDLTAKISGKIPGKCMGLYFRKAACDLFGLPGLALRLSFQLITS
jgi:hypothetical protein